jgi:CcmD family protein
MPALPLNEAGKYVAAAYIVVFALVLIYVAIMAIRLSRMQRELGELLEQAQRAENGTGPGPGLAPAAARGGLAHSGRAAGAAEPPDVGRPQSGPQRESAPA